MTSRPLIAVCGAGFWGKNHIKHFRNLGVLEAICDARHEALESFRKTDPTIRTTRRFEDILKDDKINGVVIALPTPLHYEFAKKALLAHKHVFVEKPITLKLRHAEDLCRIAVQVKKRLMVGHLLLYHPAVAMLKELVKSKELGEVYYLYAQRLNLGQVRKDENALWSLAPHDISVILELFGKPKFVQAQGSSYIQRHKGIEDVIFMHFRFQDGRTAHLHLSWLDPHKVRRITLVGSKKMVVFDDMEPANKIKIYDRGVDHKKSSDADPLTSSMALRFGEINMPIIETVEPLLRECQHFLNCVKKDSQPHSDGHNGLEVIRIMQAATLSIGRGGRSVRL